MRVWAGIIAFALIGCRESPQGFTSPDPFDSIAPGESGRLTWNTGMDQVPVWNSSSDSVYYSINFGYEGLPQIPGLLGAVPRGQGRMRLLFEVLLRGVPAPRLAAPAISPDGESVAFVELIEDNMQEVCPGGVSCPTGPGSPSTRASNALLQGGVVHVRSLRGEAAIARLPFAFDDQPDSIRLSHPFQRHWDRDRAQTFRPSWSSDGTRLVFSDGRRLYVWSIGSTSATPIPNTEDGVWPAWRPQSNTIAFTKLMRLNSYTVLCGCGGGFGGPRQYRIIYNDNEERSGELLLINADGTGRRSLGSGESPAWSRDGQSLFVSRDENIWRLTADGTNATMIENTTNGFESAISPDGRWLAFSKSKDRETGRQLYDIWFVGL